MRPRESETARIPARWGVRVWRGLGGAALAVVVVALLFQKTREASRDQGLHGGRPPAPVASARTFALIRNETAVVFTAYAGSESCRDCHKVAYDEWLKSNHGLAERLPMPAMDQPAFPAGKFQVTALGAGKSNDTFAVERVIGNDPLRQFLVRFPGGRYQALEASFDPHSNEWFNVYGNENRQPGEWGHWTGRGMNWNNMCAGCHNTRLHKNYDERTDSYASTMAEMSVGCEACHGPMRDHVVWQKANRDENLDDPTIRKFTPNQIVETCAQCHSRRGELTGNLCQVNYSTIIIC